MLMKLFIICPMVFMAGFVDAIAGGGGLISLPAYLLAGVAPHNAIATNKLSSSMGTVVSTARYAKKGFIKWKFSIPCALMAIASAPVGSIIALNISESIIKIVMLVILPVVAFYVLKTKKIGDNEVKELTRREYIVGMIVALVCGMYDGFYGPGTGTFVILMLTGIAKLDLNTAAGSTKIINLSSNLAALTTFIISGKVVYAIGLIAGIFSIAGHYTGSCCFIKDGTKIVRPIICAVLIILFVKITYEFVM